MIRTPAVHRHLSFHPLEWGCKPDLQKVPPRTERARIFPTIGLFWKVCGRDPAEAGLWHRWTLLTAYTPIKVPAATRRLTDLAFPWPEQPAHARQRDGVCWILRASCLRRIAKYCYPPRLFFDAEGSNT